LLLAVTAGDEQTCINFCLIVLLECGFVCITQFIVTLPGFCNSRASIKDERQKSFIRCMSYKGFPIKQRQCYAYPIFLDIPDMPARGWTCIEEQFKPFTDCHILVMPWHWRLIPPCLQIFTHCTSGVWA
jgi:hypothetical protein